MGFVVLESNADEAQAQEPELTLEPDWYELYCNAIAAGVDPKKFGDYTYSEIIALIDAHKLKRYHDRHFNIMEIVSNMSDDAVRDAYQGSKKGNPLRGKLLERMMRPYTPSFMFREYVQVRSAPPIPGLEAKTAEGIMQAIEQKMVTHQQWLAIHPIWQRILATARGYQPG